MNIPLLVIYYSKRLTGYIAYRPALRCRNCKLQHILRRGIMFIIVIPVRHSKVRIFCAQLLCVIVHQHRKIRYSVIIAYVIAIQLPCHVYRYGICRIVP